MPRAILFALLVLAACSAPSETPRALRTSAPVRLPASALAGAVRALEALEARRPAGAWVQVRAVEADSLDGLATPAGRVRVFLHVSVFASTAEGAHGAFELLRAALETEARETVPPEPVSPERARRVLGASGWDPAGSEALLSYSDAIRVELAPGAPAPGGVWPAGLGTPVESVGIEDYVRAQGASAGLEQLGLSLRQSDAAPGVSEMRCRIQDAEAVRGHTRAEVGAFLSALESESPAARLTQVRIERSQHAPDPHAAGAWTFEALLVVRVLAPE